MATIQINDEEHAVLRELPTLARLIYVFCCKRLTSETDYTMSFRSISEELFVTPWPGVRESGSPLVDDIVMALDILVQAGLLDLEARRLPLANEGWGD